MSEIVKKGLEHFTNDTQEAIFKGLGILLQERLLLASTLGIQGALQDHCTSFYFKLINERINKVLRMVESGECESRGGQSSE